MFTAITRFNDENVVFVAIDPETKEVFVQAVDEAAGEVYNYTVTLEE